MMSSYPAQQEKFSPRMKIAYLSPQEKYKKKIAGNGCDDAPGVQN
jgi:hypothetical protein